MYIDTSVLVAYYCPEPFSELAEQKIRTSKQPTISMLTEVELTSALARKTREGDLGQETARKILHQFQTHIQDQRFSWAMVEYPHFQMAKNWIAQFPTPLRTLDALHLAMASTHNLTLLTADSHLAAAAQSLGLNVCALP